jgi:hypothetical protein
MSTPEAPNPETRSNGAVWCLSIGVVLMGAAYFLGFGGMVAAAFAGNDPALVVGGIGMLIALPLMGVSGLVLAAVGGGWVLVRVIADQTNSAEEARYKDVQR